MFYLQVAALKRIWRQKVRSLSTPRKQPCDSIPFGCAKSTRLIVADARSSDLMIYSTWRSNQLYRLTALATIAPLRILLRDIQDENIP